MVVSSLLAMALLWSLWQRTGLCVLAHSMATAIPLDLYFHFVAQGPDNALQQGSGQWPATCVMTAYLLLLFKGCGRVCGCLVPARELRYPPG
jgi:hypothetical protein